MTSLPAARIHVLSELASVELSDIDMSLRVLLSMVVLADMSAGGIRVT